MTGQQHRRCLNGRPKWAQTPPFTVPIVHEVSRALAPHQFASDLW